MNLKVGDIVSYAILKPDPRYNLGIVLSVNNLTGLVRIRWCDGHTSLHSEMFLKRIA